MRNPTRVLVWMTAFLVVVLIVGATLFSPLRGAFTANPVFNSMILVVLLVGIIVNFHQVIVLSPEVDWIERYRRGQADTLRPPRRGLLPSVGRVLVSRAGDERPVVLSTLTMRALMDGIRSRLDEARDLSRYVVGLLIFLGLLGTFWGLLQTLSSVGSVIAGLNVGDKEVADVFNQLRNGLQQPLAGMGTAFSSSLFGLAGALVLGFFDLQAGHAQNRFYNDLEEWLSSLTDAVGGPLSVVDGSAAVPAYIQALLEKTADNLEKLQRVMSRDEEAQRAVDSRLGTFTTQVMAVLEQLRLEQKQMTQLVKSQSELPVVLSRLNQEIAGLRELNDDVRHHLSNIDVGVTTMLGDLGAQRMQTVEELRDEIRLLARTLAKIPS